MIVVKQPSSKESRRNLNGKALAAGYFASPFRRAFTNLATDRN